MRQAAEIKMGFYPIPQQVAELLIQHLACREPSKSTILDPSAGEGVALKYIADFLQIPDTRRYACELDPGRRQTIVELMPKAHVPPPCSFMGLGCSWGSFGIAYVNPPFADEAGGGGREEAEFARISTTLLCKDGVLVLVAPYDTFRKSEIYQFLDSNYSGGRLYKFPDEHRKYHESVFIGLKRAIPLVRDGRSGYLGEELKFSHYYYRASEESLTTLGGLAKIGEKNDRGTIEDIFETQPAIWQVPKCWAPTRFTKATYLDHELIAALMQSPLNQLAEASEEPPISCPPLPLDGGHMGLAIAAGAFDGIVEHPDGNHVMRGHSTKVQYFNEEASSAEPSADGETMRIKEVFSEDITLKIRAVDDTGTIYTFTADAVTQTEPDMTKTYDMSWADADLYAKLRKVTVENGSTPAEAEQARARIQKLRDRYTHKKDGTNG